MSFIEEQRKNIIQENNTAQSDFLDFLDHLHPQTTDIIVNTSLSGELDFSVLKECNFFTITSLQFSKGNITSLKNIPEGITKLVCAENLLVEIIDLPISIVELNVSGNGIKQVELVNFVNLKELNISKNQITNLTDLPKSLEILKCQNNNLKLLDLEGLTELKVLHCSNNPLLVIEHFPETITDLQMENNPLTEINKNTHSIDSDEDTGENQADFIESLHIYFELKQQYEDAVYNMKKDVFNKAKTKKAMRLMMAGLKPKCINCNRPVGSIFSNEARTYTARCGDPKNPCNFDIRIFAGEFGNIDSFLQLFQNEIEINKENIIKQKLDTLFNYIDEKDAVSIFKKQLEAYTESNMFLKELIDEYNTVFFNDERKEKIQRKVENIGKIQERFHDYIQKYKETDNRELLKDAMTIYINEIKPEMDNLQLIKNETMEINKYRDEYVLFQKPYRLDKLDFTFGSYPKVLKFRSKK
jgi:tetratricopeptide (TPR) repeat protein